jgi:hypothetical membrane protein
MVVGAAGAASGNHQPNPESPVRRATLFLLRFGVLVPFVYYGIQAAAAPFFPGFSFVGTTASEMGSSLSRHPAIFNAGIMTLGVITLLASLGYLLALRHLGEAPVLSLLVSADIALNGVQTLWAGLHPLPDPRHAGYLPFVVGMFVLPVLITLALWGRASRPLRAYFVATLVLLAAMVPVFTGVSGIDRSANRGIIQRLYTLTTFPPIAVGAWVLGRRVRERRQGEMSVGEMDMSQTVKP